MYQPGSLCRIRGPLRMWWYAHEHSRLRLDSPLLSSPKRSLALGSTEYTSSKMKADTLRYSVLKEEELEEVKTLFKKHFFPRESLTNGLHMTWEDNKEWVHISTQEWMRRGVSVVARDPATGELGGAQLSTILSRERTRAFQHPSDTSNPRLKTFYTVISMLETAVDLFARYEKVDHILELAMIAVPEKYAGCGVGKRLIQESENQGRRLGCQLATTQATGVGSQRILFSLGYETVYTMDYTTFEIDGKRVFDVDRLLGTPSVKVMFRPLKPIRMSIPSLRSDHEKGTPAAKLFPSNNLRPVH